MYCTKCGAQMPDGARFCTKCGAQMIRPRNSGNTGNTNANGANTVRQSSGMDPVRQGQNRTSGYYNGNSYGGQSSGRYASAAGNAARAAAGAGHTLRNIIIGIAAAAAALTITITVVVPKVSRPKPEDTIARMEDALNSLDQKELLECFDQQSQDLYSGTLGVMGSVMGTDLGNYSDLANGLGGMIAGAGGAPKFDLTVNGVTYSDEDHCVADVTFYVDYSGSVYEELTGTDMGSESEEVQLPMEYDDDTWKVTMSGASELETNN